MSLVDKQVRAKRSNFIQYAARRASQRTHGCDDNITALKDRNICFVLRNPAQNASDRIKKLVRDNSNFAENTKGLEFTSGLKPERVRRNNNKHGLGL